MWQRGKELKVWLTDEKYDDCLEAIDRGEELGRCDDTTGDTAATYCSNLELGGYDDWQLPTKNEYLSRMDTTRGVSFHEHPFRSSIQMYSSFYWTSSSYTKSNAWIASISYAFLDDEPKNALHYVRCVRDGQ